VLRNENKSSGVFKNNEIFKSNIQSNKMENVLSQIQEFQKLINTVERREVEVFNNIFINYLEVKGKERMLVESNIENMDINPKIDGVSCLSPPVRVSFFPEDSLDIINLSISIQVNDDLKKFRFFFDLKSDTVCIIIIIIIFIVIDFYFFLG
jgi:hypothetical protein